MPFSGFDFMRLLQDVHDRHRAQAPESLSRVYVFFGAKGGTGTTTLAYNVAAAMAQMNFRVALIDGSLQFGDVRGLLRVSRGRALDRQPADDPYPARGSRAGHVPRRLGVEVLFSPPRIEMAEMITPRDIERILSLMRKIYNVVIIDTATTLDDSVLAYIDNSDGFVQILTNEWTSLQRTRAMADTLQAISFPADKIRYLLNRADSSGGSPRDAISQALGREPDFGVVSDGVLVLDANNRACPLSRLRRIHRSRATSTTWRRT